MLLFKTSQATLDNVISNKKHALHHEPKSWKKGEVLLISKNKRDCNKDEKQIQFIMELESIKQMTDKAIKLYWPQSKNNWHFLVTCKNVKKLKTPFNLKDVIGSRASQYNPTLKPKQIFEEDEKKIIDFINK